jgi:thioredoxin-like negative regulator of GroEL
VQKQGHRPDLIVLVIAVLAVFGGSAARAAIPWETKLDRASAAARESNQPMLIEFWAVWCEGCKEMDRDVYSSEPIAAAMRKVRAVKVDIDREPALARKYEISGTPTLLVTDSFGRELFRYAGALPHDRMLQLLDALPANVSHINTLSAALAAKKDDFAALSGMGRELRKAGFYRSSSEYYGRALRTGDGRRGGEARTGILVAMERNALELRLFVDAARLCEQALTEVRGRPEEPGVRLDLGRALLGQNRTADALKVLQDLLAAHAGTPAAAEAARLLKDD